MRDAGYDPARLPPGQYLTEKWPVLHAGSVPRYADLATWTLRVFGEVEQELELTWEQFNELPRTENTQDIHCVTRWWRFDAQFEGVHWRELAKLARPKPTRALRDRARRGRLHRERARSRSSRTTTRCSSRTPTASR